MNSKRQPLYAQDPHPRTPDETIPADRSAVPTSKTKPDKVQEAAEESFPASDPPSWNPSHS